MSNSIFYPPPHPMMGGSQPLDHDRDRAATEFSGGDEPPKAHPMRTAARMMAVLSIAWAPNTFSLETLEPMVWVERVDNPPRIASQLANQINIRAQWEPETPRQPPRVYFAGEAAPPAANDPPFGLPQRWLNHVISTWLPPDPQPWFGYKLNPAFEDVPVNEPPYSHPLRVSTPTLATLLASWEPPPPQPQRAPPTQIQSVDNPPLGLTGQNNRIVLAGWTPPDPQPQRSGPLPVAVTSIVGDNPPTISKQAPPWYALENWPAQRGAQIASVIPPPVEPEKVPKGRDVLPQILSTWQPQTFVVEHTEPLVWVVRVDDPPIGKKPPIPQFEDSWEAQRSPKIAALIPQPAQVDNPPVNANRFFPQPEPTWDAQRSPQIAPLIPPQGDNPPFGKKAEISFNEPDWTSQTAAKIAPLIPASVQEKAPFVNPWAAIVNQWWQLSDPQPQRASLLPIAITSVRGDEPPRTRGPQTHQEAPTWAAQKSAQIAPLIPAPPAPVDDPPPKSGDQLSTILGIWQPGTFTLEHLEGLVFAPQVDNPPFRSNRFQTQAIIWDQWNDPVTVLEIAREPIKTEQVDNPPAKGRSLFPTIYDHWNDPVTVIEIAREPIDPQANPPFSQRKHLPIILDSWVDRTPAQQQQRKYPQGTPAEVDDPPFGYKPFRGDTTPAQWAAQETRKLIQPSVGDNPPLGYRPFQGHQAEPTWSTQETRKYPQTPPAVVNDPPFGYRPFLGDMSPESWPAQDTRKLVQPSTGDQPPRYRPFQGHAEPITWTAQARSPLTQVAPDNPPFGYNPYRGDTTPIAWNAQSRVQLPQGTPAVVNDPPFHGPLPQLYLIVSLWEPPYFPPPRLAGPFTESGPVIEQQEFRKLITLREDRIDVIKG